MSNYRYTAIVATSFNALQDAVLDYSVNKFNYHKVLLLTSMVAMIVQASFGVFRDIVISLPSLPFVVIHALVILIGYICFIKSLKYIPVALVGLIEASSLFLTFIIDAIIGYIDISLYFTVLLALFIFSIFLFSDNAEENGVKKIRPIGFVFVLLSVLFYLFAPYLIKIAQTKGANDVSINLGYYFMAVPYFWYQCHKYNRNKKVAPEKQTWWNNLYFLCLLIGILEAVYYEFETISFINDIPTVVVVISQMRVFLLFTLSVIFKTDSFSFRKLSALILGCLSVIGIYFI